MSDDRVVMFGGNAIVGAEPPMVVVDTWDGHAGERQTVLDALGAAADNLAVLTGDFQSAAVAELRADQFDEASPISTIGSWEVRAGVPGVLEVS